MILVCPSCAYEDPFEDDPCDDCSAEGMDFCDCTVRELCDDCALASAFQAEKRWPHA